MPDFDGTEVGPSKRPVTSEAIARRAWRREVAARRREAAERKSKPKPKPKAVRSILNDVRGRTTKSGARDNPDMARLIGTLREQRLADYMRRNMATRDAAPPPPGTSMGALPPPEAQGRQPRMADELITALMSVHKQRGAGDDRLEEELLKQMRRVAGPGLPNAVR